VSIFVEKVWQFVTTFSSLNFTVPPKRLGLESATELKAVLI